jgi:hypothetical protein
VEQRRGPLQYGAPPCFVSRKPSPGEGSGAPRLGFFLRLVNERFGRVSKKSCCAKGGRRMKSYRKELFFEIPSRRGFVNITPECEQALSESGVQEGLMLVNNQPI